jgi:hypothetical protein
MMLELFLLIDIIQPVGISDKSLNFSKEVIVDNTGSLLKKHKRRREIGSQAIATQKGVFPERGKTRGATQVFRPGITIP